MNAEEHNPGASDPARAEAPASWPAPSGAACLLFGGSFDPPHRAHVELPLAARDAAMPPDAWLVYIPAARSPHKPGGPLAADGHRLAMLGLAVDGHERVAVWDDELRRGGASYSLETLERAQAAAGPGAALRLLIGADQALAFHRWRGPREIIALAEPLVMPREPAMTAEGLRRGLAETGAWTGPEIDAWVGRLVETPTRAASSTAVRAGDRGALDPAVAAYIAEHGLYAGGP